MPKYRLTRFTPPPIDRGRPSAIEGLTLIDVPRAWLPEIRWRDRFWEDAPKREDVNPDDRRPVMALDDPDDGVDDSADNTTCHHGVGFDEDCDACHDEAEEEGLDLDDDDRDQGGES